MAARSFLYGGASGGDDPFFVSRSSTFQGSRSMLSFEDRGDGSGGQFFQSYDHEDNGDDEYDEYFHQPEKKRRLTADQVRFLEKGFEEDIKLEPDRKIQLAKDLGLQPRQVAIWFQNRRARWKNKQLEKDYDDLQESYNKLKANYENLVKEKEKLKSEVDELSDKLMLQEKGTSDSSSTKSPSEQQLCQHNPEEEVTRNINTGYRANSNFTSKNVEFENGVHASIVERADSSYVFEQEQSEGSMDPNSVNSYILGFPGDDQDFGFWSY